MSSVRSNVESAKLAPGVIPGDIKLHDYAFSPKNYTWKDVDTYYRNEVLVKHKDDSYYDNLRKSTIFVLVNQFDVLQNADLNSIEFYANELMTTNLPDPDVFLKVMKRLQGHWPDKKIQEYALHRYADTQEFIQTQLKEPQKYLQEQGAKYEQIKTFAESLESK
ncbi:MAG: hypothetical protein OHK0019_18390 [Saprospiraceae bacterium]